MNIQAKLDSAARYNEQKELLEDLRRCLYETALSVAILDRHIYNHGLYVNLNTVEKRSMRSTLELYKGIVMKALED